ncbi:hypothetical protein DEAC_c27250 [Desulfosporosinus acididurans]|uniref:UPF0178 protein DEAC_c27250 n=1 Tax=Desulfosporosinus acididurans TaxID=476652 RepID=A0A0J1FQC4_9FIRM|nr:DUF188 domain-containing protein [Desulfosporosinus acididurans]KLU65173.1 hypothetical protein DEAC_c27250 [Desulfosporosinus acididurans]
MSPTSEEGRSAKILVDADACPRSVLQICLRLAKIYSIQVWTIASFNHKIESDFHVVVGNASQEADIRLMNLAHAGDVAVTQDWGLAAMLLGKGVRCLNPTGREFSNDTIEFLLEERETKAKFRRGGGRTKGPQKRKLEDDQFFEDSLRRILQDIYGIKSGHEKI